MRCKVLLVLMLCAALGAALAQPVFCGWHWETTRITNTPYFESAPRVWGDTVYFSDFRSGTADIYSWDAVNGTRPVLQIPDSQILQSVYEDKLLIANYVNSQYDLYVWDPAGGMRPVSTGPANQYHADISGDLVVYEDYSTGVSQVWMWDPVNGNRPISPTGYSQTNPRVDHGRVVWDDLRNGRGDVYMWTAEGGVERLSTYIYGMVSPDVYGDRVVMTVPWQEQMWDPYGIWEWQAGHGLVGAVVPYHYGGRNRIWGDLIVCGNGAYHPSTGFIEMGLGTVFDVYGNSIVCADENYDIWKMDLVPEPSSLLALAGLAGGLAFLRRRR